MKIDEHGSLFQTSSTVLNYKAVRTVDLWPPFIKRRPASLNHLTGGHILKQQQQPLYAKMQPMNDGLS